MTFKSKLNLTGYSSQRDDTGFLKGGNNWKHWQRSSPDSAHQLLPPTPPKPETPVLQISTLGDGKTFFDFSRFPEFEPESEKKKDVELPAPPPKIVEIKTIANDKHFDFRKFQKEEENENSILKEYQKKLKSEKDAKNKKKEDAIFKKIAENA